MTSNVPRVRLRRHVAIVRLVRVAPLVGVLSLLRELRVVPAMRSSLILRRPDIRFERMNGAAYAEHRRLLIAKVPRAVDVLRQRKAFAIMPVVFGDCVSFVMDAAIRRC
jgi:hypothetical protein